MASTYLISPSAIMMITYPSAKRVVHLAAPAISSTVFEVNVKKHQACMRANASSNLLRTKWMLMSVPLPSVGTNIISDLSDEEQNSWNLCRKELSRFQFETDEVDKILGKAFGHVHSPYWGEERAKEIPKYETVNNILNYLRSLTLTDEDLAKILKKFPEVLGCSLENEVKNNVAVLEKEWSISGKSLRNLLLRNPKVLGYNVDCKGSCVAQCTRCWVRF